MVRKVKALGYKDVDATTATAQLTRYLKHREIGFLCYGKCTDDEITDFLLSRKSPSGGHAFIRSITSRERATEILLQDDETPSFSRFFDLPPELRNHVYKFYDSSLEDRLINPVMPPLAQTCRTVKKEFLPIFFDSHEFEIRFIRSGRSTATPNEQIPGFREDTDTQFWLSTLSDAKTAMIRRLKLVVSDRYKRSGSNVSFGVVGWFNVHASHPCKSQLEPATVDGKLTDEWDDEIFDKVREELRKVLKGVERDGSRMVVKVQDIHSRRLGLTTAYR